MELLKKEPGNPGYIFHGVFQNHYLKKIYTDLPNWIIYARENS